LKILLLDGAVTKLTLSGGTALAAGSFKWNVPTSLPKGNNYRMRIISRQNPSLQDTSDQPFAIGMAPPGTKLTVTSPAGGESWQRGTSRTITWTYTGQPGNSVKIVLLKSGVLFQTITAQVPLGADGSGSFTWTIPASLAIGRDFTIRVRSITYADCRDQSDRPFSITR
jgi:hypothetical protein